MSVHQSCPTCTCVPKDALIVYPPNAQLYERCVQCDQPRWHSEFYAGGTGLADRRKHCGCCPPGCQHHTKEGEASDVPIQRPRGPWLRSDLEEL